MDDQEKDTRYRITIVVETEADQSEVLDASIELAKQLEGYLSEPVKVLEDEASVEYDPQGFSADHEETI